MKKEIIHPNIDKVGIKIRNYALVDGKIEETEKEIQLPKAIVNPKKTNESVDKENQGE